MLFKSRRLPQGLAIASQSVEFWRRLAPELTISDTMKQDIIVRNADQDRTDRMRLVNEGYLHLKQPGLTAPLAKLSKAMKRIVEAGMPAAFIGVYDETWAVAAQLQSVTGGLLGAQSALVPNFWASSTGVGDTGETARRHRAGVSLNRDRTPKSVSIWVPVTEATVDNGCMYLVPADQDQNYGKADPERADARLHGIKALPAMAGDVVITTGEVYQWRARTCRHNQDGPLMSLSWEFQSASDTPLDGPLISSYPHVPFETRLGLLAHQMPRHRSEMSNNPVWRAVQKTLANRFPIGATSVAG